MIGNFPNNVVNDNIVSSYRVVYYGSHLEIFKSYANYSSYAFVENKTINLGQLKEVIYQHLANNGSGLTLTFPYIEEFIATLKTHDVDAVMLNISPSFSRKCKSEGGIANQMYYTDTEFLSKNIYYKNLRLLNTLIDLLDHFDTVKVFYIAHASHY